MLQKRAEREFRAYTKSEQCGAFELLNYTARGTRHGESESELRLSRLPYHYFNIVYFLPVANHIIR
jgi:hypothetical protein